MHTTGTITELSYMQAIRLVAEMRQLTVPHEAMTFSYKKALRALHWGVDHADNYSHRAAIEHFMANLEVPSAPWTDHIRFYWRKLKRSFSKWA